MLSSSRSKRRSSLIESLESRLFLSAAPIATPASNDIGPGSTSPVGFSPVQIRSAYGIDKIRFGSITGDGSGQTIAVINAYDNPKLVSSTDSGYANSDLAKFNAQFGLTNSFSFKKVSETGGTNYPTTDPSGSGHWANEAALDVEWLHVAAPKANIILVECSNAYVDHLLQVGGNWARNQPQVSVINMSFGVPDFANEGIYDQYLTTPSGHQGITFVASTGDSGAPGTYPAASPNVVGTGGTSLAISGFTYSSETGSAHSGGGVTAGEAKPSYQSSISFSSSRRMLPDVAFDGDPNTGVAVYDSYNGGSSNPWYKEAGTSLGAPVWAGLIAIANQGRAAMGQGTLDGRSQTLPRLYGLSSSDFHDVTSGSNGTYSAGPGYDLVTGLGTPRADSLVPHLAGYTNANTAIISGTVFNDLNGNGSQNGGENGIPSITVYNDSNNNKTRDPGELTTTTNSSGYYSFSSLASGNYKIRAVIPAGWTQTSPANGYGWTITLSSGQNSGNNKFGLRQSAGTGVISGIVFNDLNGNGWQSSGENGLASYRVYNDANNNHIWDPVEISVLTDSNGYYQFNGLFAGNYKIRAIIPAGWTQTSPANGYGWTLALASGQQYTGKSFGLKK